MSRNTGRRPSESERGAQNEGANAWKIMYSVMDRLIAWMDTLHVLSAQQADEWEVDGCGERGGEGEVAQKIRKVEFAAG